MFLFGCVLRADYADSKRVTVENLSLFLTQELLRIPNCQSGLCSPTDHRFLFSSHIRKPENIQAAKKGRFVEWYLFVAQSHFSEQMWLSLFTSLARDPAIIIRFLYLRWGRLLLTMAPLAHFSFNLKYNKYRVYMTLLNCCCVYFCCYLKNQLNECTRILAWQCK